MLYKIEQYKMRLPETYLEVDRAGDQKNDGYGYKKGWKYLLIRALK